MKLISWNVNGLRACLNKGFLDFFAQADADFFCLQETKLQEGQVELELPGYYQFWNYAEKKGYSGTAIFAREAPLEATYGLGIPELDTEGRLITLEYRNYFVVTCYTPNAQDGLKRIDHRMRWEDAFRDYLTELDRIKPVLVCGDLNVAHKEIDLKNPGPNRGNAGFSDQERGKFTELLEAGFTDSFRYLYPEAAGRYSWWSYRLPPEKTTQDGALTIGWFPAGFKTKSRKPVSNPIFSAPIIAPSPWCFRSRCKTCTNFSEKIRKITSTICRFYRAK